MAAVGMGPPGMPPYPPTGAFPGLPPQPALGGLPWPAEGPAMPSPFPSPVQLGGTGCPAPP